MAAAAGRRRPIVTVVGGRRLDPRCLAHGVGERLEVVGVRDGCGELAHVPQHLPAARNGQAHCVLLAEVVGVRFGEGRQRPDDRGEVGVGVGERGDGRPAAAVRCNYERRRSRPHSPARLISGRDSSAIGAFRDAATPRRVAAPARAVRWPRAHDPRSRRQPARAAPAATAAGAGCAAGIAPKAVPISRTPSEVFDDLVLDAVEELEDRWSAELAGLEFAVEDVPPTAARHAALEFDPEVIVDRGIPLGRLFRAGLGSDQRAGDRALPAPVGGPGGGPDDRADLVFAVVAELVAEYLGIATDRTEPTRFRRLRRAALEAAALALGQPAPDTEALVLRRAYSRHSPRTSQPVQIFFASRVDPPFSGKKASGSVCAHRARSCQLASSGRPNSSDSSAIGKIAG